MIERDALHRLYRYSLALTHQNDVAFDLVHEAVIACHQKIVLNKEAYLKRVIRNLYYHHNLKMQKETEIDTEKLCEQFELESRTLDQATLKSMLTELKPEEREVLFLVCVEGRSYKEAASYMGVKQGTVMSRLHRCKQRMRRYYEEFAW